MNQIVQQRKAIVRWVLLAVLVADCILAGLYWRLNASPRMPGSELRRLELLEKSYRADNTRLERFRTELPVDEKQWDQFFTQHFRPAGAGYSAISADLGELSRSAGLRTGPIAFHQHGADARGLVEVEITTSVEGDYESLINFLNRLEHSENFYVLDSLSLASSSAGRLRLNLQLRTYFRS